MKKFRGKDIYKLAKEVGELLLSQRLSLVTAESCTGGGVASAITAVPGSSQWFDRGFVTYSNVSKEEVLKVKAKTLKYSGAVSEDSVKAMVKGALAHSRAQVAVAVSGIAGPDGGTAAKPVGTVWIAWMYQHKKRKVVKTKRYLLKGSRQQIQKQTVREALIGIKHLITI